MPFVRKQVSADATGFGADVREMRELRGYTQRSLGKISGIHPSIIAALEEERIEDLSDPVYAERHIRTLADILETRPDFFLQKYRALLDARGFGFGTSPVLPMTVRRRDLFVTSRVFVALGFFLFVALLVGYVVWQTLLVSHAPDLTVDAPTEGQVVMSPHVDVAGRTDPTASVVVNGKQAIVDQSGVFRISIDVSQGVSTIHVESRRRYSRPNAVDRHVIFESTQTGP